jgi:AcrR family transcriptional regulator
VSAELPAANGRTRGSARRDATRRTLLDSAAGVFAERGYAAATIEDIIRASGLARATFYNHFRGKAEVFEAIAGEHAKRTVPLAEGMGPITPDAAGLATLRAFIREFLELSVAYAGLNAAFVEADRSEAIVAQTTTRDMGRLNRILARHLREGGFETAHANFTALALIAMFDRFEDLARIGEIDITWDATADALARWTLTMLYPNADARTLVDGASVGGAV